MNKYEEILNNISKQLENDKTEHNEWNTNYLRIQRERYISDLMYYENLEGINKILEIGGAPFHLSACMQKLKYDLTVLDIDPSRFQWFIEENKMKVIKCNIENDIINLEDNSFDLAIFTEVFEHLRINPINTLLKIREKIKMGGLLYLTTPNFYRFANIVSFLKNKGVVNAYYEFEKLNKIGHMGHVREYTKNEINLFLENTGFEVKEFSFKNAKKATSFNTYNAVTRLFPGTRTHMKFLAKKV